MTDWRLHAEDIELLLDSITCMLWNLNLYPNYTFKKISRLAQMAEMLTEEFNRMNNTTEQKQREGLPQEDLRELKSGEVFVFGQGIKKKGDSKVTPI